MIKTPGELRNYMEVLATENKHIRKFFYGDYDDILGAERVKMEYPLLWMESPEVDPADEDHFSLVFSFAWLVLLNSPIDDKQRNLYNSEKAFRIALGIIARMVNDDEDGIINFDIDDVQLMEVRRAAGNNNETGWRVEMKILSNIAICYNENDWEGNLPEGIVPRFTWVIDGKVITLSNNSEPGAGYTINWRCKFDHFDETVLEDHLDVVEVSPAEWLSAYIIMELEGANGVKVMSSAIFVNEDETEGESVIGLYEK